MAADRLVKRIDKELREQVVRLTREMDRLVNSRIAAIRSGATAKKRTAQKVGKKRTAKKTTAKKATAKKTTAKKTTAKKTAAKKATEEAGEEDKRWTSARGRPAGHGDGGHRTGQTAQRERLAGCAARACERAEPSPHPDRRRSRRPGSTDVVHFSGLLPTTPDRLGRRRGLRPRRRSRDSSAIRHDRTLSVADLALDSEVRSELRRSIHEINAVLSRASHIRRFAVLGHEWLPDSDELTASMKLRRQKIHAKYASEIEALYGLDHETI